jgi:quinol monooxygenase YgiN
MTPSTPIITIAFTLEASLGKKRELLRTLDELHPMVLQETGCLRVSLSRPELIADMVTLSEEWATPKDALRHFGSEPFHLINGAIVVLAKSALITINVESQSVSIDLKSGDLPEKRYPLLEKALLRVTSHASIESAGSPQI